ncbi:putative DNA-binding domain-containing protein [Roseovarius aestuariivivens]|uniref:HvfC/BufC family peptide modification chaperone n=1 Tax=Roseovarius aestuariivivens TaxID=1888910 RepID=UPI00107FF89A|nr:putative DNA-binding domain-containing protein [Roseovarius aestuariivivens]
MSVRQDSFRAAVLDPLAAVPEGLKDGQGRPAGRRFSVYRNNVVAGLITAIETSFPATAKLLGPEEFLSVASLYVRKFPPDTPMMMYYGASFPAFLQQQMRLDHLPQVADLARLEQTRREAYHASDAAPADPGELAGLAPEALANMRFDLAPALRLLRSDWPVHAIWAFHMTDDAPPPGQEAQNVLITRPAFDPEMAVIDTPTCAFLSALQSGATLAEAESAADAPFDLTAALGLLLQGQAIHQIIPGDIL